VTSFSFDVATWRNFRHFRSSNVISTAVTMTPRSICWRNCHVTTCFTVRRSSSTRTALCWWSQGAPRKLQKRVIMISDLDDWSCCCKTCTRASTLFCKIFRAVLIKLSSNTECTEFITWRDSVTKETCYGSHGTWTVHVWARVNDNFDCCVVPHHNHQRMHIGVMQCCGRGHGRRKGWQGGARLPWILHFDIFLLNVQQKWLYS